MNEVIFGTLGLDGMLGNVRLIKQDDIRKCPHYILIQEHYREDGTCKCDDAEYRKAMREWGYKSRDFKDIPLR